MDLLSGVVTFVTFALVWAAFVMAIVALVRNTKNPVYIATSSLAFNLPSNAANNTVMISAPVGEVAPSYVYTVTLPESLTNGTTMQVYVQPDNKVKLVKPVGSTLSYGAGWNQDTEWEGLSLAHSPVFV